MKQYYRIGEISALYNIGTDSLRYYEELGILKPRRDSNGYRMYSINDIRTLNILRELRAIGFSMSQIKEHLKNFDLQKTMELFGDAVDAIDKKVEELTTLRAQLAERIADIQYHIVSEDRNGGIEVREIETRPVLKLSENVLRDEELDFVIKKLQTEYEDQLYIIGNGDIGATIPLDYLRSGRYGHFDSVFYIVEKNQVCDAIIPGGKYAVMTVCGSYSKIAAQWQMLFDYLKEQNLEPDGNPMELYIIDNHDTGNEEEYITELQVKVKTIESGRECREA